MKPIDLMPGDECRFDDGSLSYTVLATHVENGHIQAHVRYPDGGTGWRAWSIDTEDVDALVRPEAAQ